MNSSVNLLYKHPSVEPECPAMGMCHGLPVAGAAHKNFQILRGELPQGHWDFGNANLAHGHERIGTKKKKVLRSAQIFLRIIV